jgi:hypothetical protein
MKTRIAALCGAMVIGGLTLTAQSPPSSQTQPTTRPSTPATPGTQSSHRGGEAMTVTGCLKTWDDARAADRSSRGPGAASSGAATSVAAAKYVLTDVDAGKSAGSAAATGRSAAGTSSTSASTATRTSFALTATGTSIDFSKHVNHKVELTGKLEPSAHQTPEARSSGTSGSTGTATPGRDDSAMGMAMPTLHVTALKMVSATCS